MARPVTWFTTTRSVVADWAAEPGKPSATAQIRLTSDAIKAIPGRKPVRGVRPFLSCRCAVIVDADNIRVVGGHRAQPKTMAIGVRLRPGPGFDTQGYFYDFRITPCRGGARRADGLGCARLRSAAAAAPASVRSGGSSAAAIATAATAAEPQHLRP